MCVAFFIRAVCNDTSFVEACKGRPVGVEDSKNIPWREEMRRKRRHNTCLARSQTAVRKKAAYQPWGYLSKKTLLERKLEETLHS